MSTDPRPPARPLYRKLAAGVAVVCFGLAVAARFVTGDDWFGPVLFLGFGFVMAAIAATGYLPGRR